MDEMDELDHYLKELAETARQSSSGSPKRRKAIQRLLQAIRKSGKLFCKGRYDYPPELYHDALQNTLEYVAKKIDRYDPTLAKMMTWVNRKLDFAFKDEIKKFKEEQTRKFQERSFVQPYDRDNDVEPPYLSDQLRLILEEDLEGVFKAKHLRGRPDVNFKMVALYRIENEKLRRLADNLNVKEQTLYSFFRRACIEMRPHIERYLQDF